MRAALIIFLAGFQLLTLVSCHRDHVDPVNNTGNSKLSYGDSIFFIKSQDYVISPASARQGTYSAFPDNLMIDPATGKITVSVMGKGNESQTGLKYRIKFTDAVSGESDSTYIILSGINYLDQIHYLANNDSIVSPIYNADPSKPMPSGTYGIANDSRLAIDPQTGKINVKECMRRGLFDLPAENGEWEELTVQYKSNDNSNTAMNRIDVAIYYYKTINDIPVNVSEAMQAHQRQVLGISQPAIPATSGPFENDLPDNLSLFKPRPPCVIIVGQ